MATVTIQRERKKKKESCLFPSQYRRCEETWRHFYTDVLVCSDASSFLSDEQ